MSWMKELSEHYERTRDRFPNDTLVIAFDIDNTIIDMREMIAAVLRGYDREHGTRHFAGLVAGDLDINENQVDAYLGARGFDRDTCDAIHAWYVERRWSSEAILRSHRPFAGVMEVIRWFQMQARTRVVLITGRMEEYRHDTLRSLNELGREFKVRFESAGLYMYRGEGAVSEFKAGVVRGLVRDGYRVFAVVDNEPDNLEAVALADADRQILPVHADTIFDSKRTHLPGATVSGSDYDLTELIAETDLPGHVQFVWHGLNDPTNVRQFLASEVRWGECDVRLDTEGRTVVLREDSFRRRTRRESETLLALDDVLPRFRAAGKSLKLDVKEGGALVDAIVECVDHFGVEGRNLWFNADARELEPGDFERLRARFPDAVIQCPVDYLVPIMFLAPSVVRERIDAYRAWGINRVSLDWKTRELTDAMSRLEEWGFDVNLYNVPDLESFLKAVLLQPRSVSADFNFPKWHYFGRGAGANRVHHTYALSPAASR